MTLSLRIFSIQLTVFFAFTLSAQTKEITILAVNDMHASIDRFPKFIALVDSIRAIHPDLLLFAAGDNRTGNPVNDMHPEPSSPMVALMNRAGFNLSTLGNHEFDGQIEGLRSVLNRSTFRHVAANMFAHDSLRLHVEPYKFFEIDNIRIAVLGLIQMGDNGYPDAHPNNMGPITFQAPLQAAEKYSWLRNQSDLFVILMHEGYDEGIQLSNQYPYADLIISGHSHTPVMGTEIYNGVLLTQAESHLKYITQITIQLTDGKVTKKESRLINVNTTSLVDNNVQAMVDEYNDNEFLKRALTEALTDFETKEEIGSLLCDALIAETGADIALQNPGGVRIPTLPKGPLTMSDVYRIDPFGNEVVEYVLTGKEVLRLIEAAYYGDIGYGPPFVGGITYEMELDNEGRVKNLQVKIDNGGKFNEQKTYRVVMNSYLATICQFEKSDPGKNLFVKASDVTISYLEKQAAVDYLGVKRVTVKN